MMYVIECKQEYINSWAQELMDRLKGFATVEITSPDSKKTLFFETNHIDSPLGEYSVFINNDSDNNLDDAKQRMIAEYSLTTVYIVSEGGYIILCGMFYCDKISYGINWSKSKVINKQKYEELSNRVKDILSNMKEDDDSLPHSITKTNITIYCLLILLFSLIITMFIVCFGDFLETYMYFPLVNSRNP